MAHPPMYDRFITPLMAFDEVTACASRFIFSASVAFCKSQLLIPQIEMHFMIYVATCMINT